MLGAIVMRTGMILAGVWLVSEFAWVLFVFGAFLVVTGIKMLAAPWFHVPIQWSLGIVDSIILVSVILSLKLSGCKLSGSAS